MDLPTGPELNLSDYIGVIKRRGRLLYSVMGGVVMLGVIIAYRVPPLYASTGTLLAEQPEVPEHVARSTVSENPEDRVRIVTQRVLTSDNLEHIVAANHLYPELDATPLDAVAEFRDHLALSAEDPEILEDLLGSHRAADATAFSVTFSDPSPRVARDVAKSLVALYLQENQQARREQAQETTQFLAQQSKRLESQIAEREKSLATFKRRHAGALPETADLNRQLIDRTECDVDAADQEIRSLRERRSLYASELSQLSPFATVVDEDGQTMLGPDQRLALLERRYAQLTAVYSQDHPDVIKVRREIEALRSAAGMPATDRSSLQAELAAREDELAAARNRYSDDHPDVRRLEKTVAGLREALAKAAPSTARKAAPIEPDNPQYIQRKVELDATESDIQAALTHREELNARLTDLQQHSTAAPDVERDYNSLKRGYDQLLAAYDDVQRKLHEAEVAVNLESENASERFAVLQDHSCPTTRPPQQNRPRRSC